MPQARIFNVRAGDRVKLEFPGLRKPPVAATILHVERRYGKDSYGRVSNPLITHRSDFGEVSSCDASHVAEILRRGAPLLTNIFADRLVEVRERVSPGPMRGTMRGRLADLAAFELAHLPFRLTQPLDEAQLRRLFLAQRPGLLKWIVYGHEVIVRRRTFRKWVHANAYRILKTVAQLTKAQTERRRSDESIMRADLVAALEADLRDDLTGDSRGLTGYEPYPR